MRGTGGYILAPPSIHPSGRPYVWSVDSSTSFASAPAWLIHKIATPARRARGQLVDLAAARSQWRDLVENGCDEGARNNSVTRLAGYLLNRHVDPLVALKLLHCWNVTSCRPPLPAQDVERICRSIAARELRKQTDVGD